MDTTTVFFQHQLESGVQVIGQPMGGVESAALGFLVGTGARDEPNAQAGITHFVEQMLFRGTQRRDARALVDALESLGVNYDASAGLEMTLVSGVQLGDRLLAALDILAEVVREPAFPPEDIDSVRQLILQEHRQREDRPAQMVMDRLRQEFFAGSPLSHDVLGTEESVSALTRDDLFRYWEARFTANNIVVSVTGNFDWDAVIERLNTLSAAWPTGAGRSTPPAPEPQSGVHVQTREATQENVGFAFSGVPSSDPRYYSLACAIQALGGGSNSRLFREVREKRGLAYAVSARYDALEKTGLVRVYCGTSADRAHESVEVIQEELRKLEDDGITDDELRLAKTRLKSQVIMRSESTSARMVANLRSWWFENRLRTLQEISDEIDRVTVERIRDIVQAVGVTRTLTAVAIGPRTEEELFGRAVAWR
ncbi:MAG TPA: pitrilysin family protein [Chloroflexota bacterium]|nr:pitrilysin family protein [Chloroflexota bacterium]